MISGSVTYRGKEYVYSFTKGNVVDNPYWALNFKNIKNYLYLDYISEFEARIPFSNIIINFTEPDNVRIHRIGYPIDTVDIADYESIYKNSFSKKDFKNCLIFCIKSYLIIRNGKV